MAWTITPQIMNPTLNLWAKSEPANVDIQEGQISEERDTQFIQGFIMYKINFRWFLNMCFLLIDILKLYNLMYRKVSVLHNKFKQVRWNIKSQSMSNYQQDLSNLVYVKFCICRILYMSNFTMSYFEFHLYLYIISV